MKRALRPWLLVASGLALGACQQGSEGGKAGRGATGPSAFPVQVQEVEVRPVEYTVHAVGSVEAFERVQVTARVAGVVERVLFAEGQAVKEEEVLAEIEPARYRLALQASRAALRKASAAKDEAEASLKRRMAAEEASPGLIPGEELEGWRTRASAAAADFVGAQVAVDQAHLNLQDAYVKAPVAGVLQTRTVQTGQYVQPGHVLATLLRRDPLLVRFKVPEGEAGRLEVGGEVRFSVRGDARAYSAKMTHIAAAAEEASRMVPVTAEVDAEHREALRPGAFAEVTVPVGQVRQMPAIPQTGVRPSERGFLAFVVEGGLAKERVLELGLRTADGLVEVRAGLKPGEQLVVRGAEALQEGAPVRVETEAPQQASPPHGVRAAGAPGPAQTGGSR